MYQQHQGWQQEQQVETTVRVLWNHGVASSKDHNSKSKQWQQHLQGLGATTRKKYQHYGT